MGLFQRLFSSEYREALAAEAEGSFLAAARAYALCGEMHKVVDMHLAQARIEGTAEGRIRELRLALTFTKEGDERRLMVLRMLGQALREQALSVGLSCPEGRRSMEEAADLLAQGEAHVQAGDCYLELRDRSRAAAAYSRAGLIERVEEVLGQEEQERTREQKEDSSFADYQMLMQAGQRDEAAETLRECIDAAQSKGDYRRVLADLEGRILATGRVTLRLESRTVTLVGHYPLVLGRDADCDFQVRGHTVSRRHTRLVLDPEQGLLVEDAGSRNGTLLNGLPLGAAVPLPPSGTIGLGTGSEVAFELVDPACATVKLAVTRGIDLDRIGIVSAAPIDLARVLAGGPALCISFSRGRPLAQAAGGPLLLNEASTAGPVQLILGDVLEMGGQRVHVEG